MLLDPRLNWAYRMEEQCRRFLEKIPRELRRIIRLFPERHFDLLCLLARCGPAAAELLGETNPALGFALALPRSFMRPAVQRPWRSVRALLRRRQRDIAARLGFAPSEAGRRLLLKIPHESTRLANLKALLRAMDDPFWLKALQHAKRLNTGALLIAGNAQLRRYASARFVQQLGNDVYQDRESYAVRQLRDVIEMRHLLPERRRAFCVHSLGELAALHEEYVATINGHGGTSALAERTYPPPPLPDEGHTITAVKNTGELRELAQACSNCALTRNKRISEYYYVYRVEYKGELATLALSGEKGGIYRVEEMAGRRNARCSPALRSEVCHWIQKHQPASMKVAAAPISANSDRSM
ncbi:MAG TPA: hypothetical protein VEK08_01520 [Planctomycetota bacterium]|nr:hypothetical protein [Planctomycetota bacterium]